MGMPQRSKRASIMTRLSHLMFGAFLFASCAYAVPVGESLVHESPDPLVDLFTNERQGLRSHASDADDLDTGAGPGQCPAGWMMVNNLCYSPSTTGRTTCTSSDCDQVAQRCGAQGARLPSKDELHAWLANGGKRTSHFGVTSTRQGSKHWLLDGVGDYGWHDWTCCDHPNRYYVCVKDPRCPAGWMGLNNLCYSPSTTGRTTCTSSDCDQVAQRCGAQGARLPSKDELHAWLANGGKRTSHF